MKPTPTRVYLSVQPVRPVSGQRPRDPLQVELVDSENRHRACTDRRLYPRRRKPFNWHSGGSNAEIKRHSAVPSICN